MTKDFYTGNRKRLYEMMKPASLLVIFSGLEVRKTNDEFYPFHTHRNFLYLTGIEGKELALLAVKDQGGRVTEKLFLLPPDLMAERWTGRRVKPDEAAEISGIENIGFAGELEGELHRSATCGVMKISIWTSTGPPPPTGTRRRICCSGAWPRTIRISGWRTPTRL